MKYITLSAFVSFIVYALASLSMLGLFTKIYLWCTPYDEFKQIRNGDTAPAITLSGAMLGFVLPILSVSYHGVNLLDFVIWATVAGIVQIVFFKLTYWFMPMEYGMGEISNLNTKNNAIAILYAGVAICVGLINAFSLIPQ